MSKPRERVKKILDWEALERAPNTHGALSFLKSAAEIVSIRKNDDVKAPAPSEKGRAILGRNTPLPRHAVA